MFSQGKKRMIQNKGIVFLFTFYFQVVSLTLGIVSATDLFLVAKVGSIDNDNEMEDANKRLI